MSQSKTDHARLTPAQMALQALAEKATHGPWFHAGDFDVMRGDGDAEQIAGVPWAGQGSARNQQARRDAAYIAAAHPTAILTLLADLGAREAEVSVLRAGWREFLAAEAFIDTVADAREAAARAMPYDDDFDRGRSPGLQSLHEALIGLSLWAYDREDAARAAMTATPATAAGRTNVEDAIDAYWSRSAPEVPEHAPARCEDGQGPSEADITRDAAGNKPLTSVQREGLQ